MVVITVLLAGLTEAANVGRGYGESLWTLTTARQAGTGGIRLEDAWREGMVLEATTVVLEPDLRWYGIGGEGVVGPRLRAGFEGFMFSSPGITHTTETGAGTFGEDRGVVDVTEWGGRATGRLGLLERSGWEVEALGRASGLVQDVDKRSSAGLALEAGAQARKAVAGAREVTVWGLAGPLGWGDRRAFSAQLRAGAGIEGTMGENDGYGVGVEADLLGEGLIHGGLGGVYRVGRPGGKGMTLYLRSGLKYAQGSAQEVQPRVGVGLLWRAPSGYGLQFDYAYVPIGELGAYHYGSLGVGLPQGRKERAGGMLLPPGGGDKAGKGMTPGPVPTPEPGVQSPAAQSPAPSAPAVERMPEAVDEVHYFAAGAGEVLRLPIDVAGPSIFGAKVLDGEGREVLKELVPPHEVEAGRQWVEWDGTTAKGDPVPLEFTYIIRVTCDGQTKDVKVVPRKGR